jgi:hypothetical protein
MSTKLEQLARRIDAAVPPKKNEWARSALVPWKLIAELRQELARIDAARASRATKEQK